MGDSFDSSSDDPLIHQRGLCMEKDCKVKSLFKVLEACKDRVESKSNTAETCQQEMVDLIMAIDHCIGNKAFVKLA